MKKLLIFITLLTLTMGVYAQETSVSSIDQLPKHEISLGIGSVMMEYSELELPYTNLFFYNTPQITISGIDFNPQTYYAGPKYTTGAIAGSYSYQLSKKYSIGFSLSYTGFNNLYYDAYSNELVGSRKCSQFGFIPKVKYNWFTRPYLNVYSSAGIGLVYTFINAKTSPYRTDLTYSLLFTGQLTLLGINYGKDFFVFGEILCLGQEGTARAGFGYRFNSSTKIKENEKPNL